MRVISQDGTMDFPYDSSSVSIYGGCAVSILSQCWEYGEYLRKWHNKEYGYDGDGVVNPAVMTVGVDDET